MVWTAAGRPLVVAHWCRGLSRPGTASAASAARAADHTGQSHVRALTGRRRRQHQQRCRVLVTRPSRSAVFSALRNVARIRLTSSRGAVDVVDADARKVDTVLSEAARTLDITKPVGLLMLGVLSHILDDHKAKPSLPSWPQGSHPAAIWSSPTPPPNCTASCCATRCGC
ncbi:hypothetical protein GCM10010182_81860 [Actinomadura cremea]|nr:hypothetical protein GCM10010182_81860 [Actinomadura cremea]